MGAIEIILLIINALAGGGLIYTIMFFGSKKRKENAEASHSEHTSEATAIQNVRDSAVEWREIADNREEELKRERAEREALNNKIERLYDLLRKEQIAHAKTASELSKALVKIEQLTTQKCIKRGCTDRTPPSDY